jgi:hypothetical protein
MEVSGQLHALAALPPIKQFRWKLGEPDSRSVLYGEEKNALTLSEIVSWLLGRPAPRSVTVPTLGCQ